MDARGPTNQQRTLVLGRTGSGKSQFAISLLASRDFHKMPWVIIDYKGEDLLRDIMEACPGAIKEIKATDNPPKKPGLYYMHPRPLVDDALVEAFLWKVHRQGKCGLFIDEGYCLPDKGAFTVLLTQGRTLYIPIICLYQRPVWMNRFAVAQADFVAVFAQMDERDMKTCSYYVKPVILENKERITPFSDLPNYHCLWYDVGRGITSVLRPAPERDDIINHFIRRLKPRKMRALI